MTRAALTETTKILHIEFVVCRDGSTYSSAKYSIRLSDDADVVICIPHKGIDCVAIGIEDIIKVEGFLRNPQ